jgi:DNA polymerase
MVVGEAPGRQEDVHGRPFVGPAGKLLWTELAKVGVRKELVLRANAVSCWPNGTPNDSEVYACRANLYNQIEYCEPKVLLVLGRIANWSLGRGQPMSQIHGTSSKTGRFHGRSYDPYDEIELFTTYHPAAVLRNRSLMRRWREDLQAFANKAQLFV